MSPKFSNATCPAVPETRYMSHLQWRVLHVMCERHDRHLASRDVAEVLAIWPSNAHNALSRLEKRGLVRNDGREPLGFEGRPVIAWRITERGVEAIRRIGEKVPMSEVSSA